jgi:hypothetical protein
MLVGWSSQPVVCGLFCGPIKKALAGAKRLWTHNRIFWDDKKQESNKDTGQ